MKRVLDPIERQILKVLIEHSYYLTTTEVSKKAKVSWNTAYNHLKEFHRLKWINLRKRGNRKLWKAVVR